MDRKKNGQIKISDFCGLRYIQVNHWVHALLPFGRIAVFVFFGFVASLILSATNTWAAMRYVSITGSDSGNTCTDPSSPCGTIARGVSQMSGGDTLIIGDGTYVNDPIINPPSGNYGVDNTDRTSDDIYTTIRAENDGRVVIDMSGVTTAWSDTGVAINGRSYIVIQGIQVKGSKDINDSVQQSNGPFGIGTGSAASHIKIIRCSVYNAADTGNMATMTAGTNASYVLFEECWTWGTGRYKFVAYQADHVIFRRCVARHDWHSNAVGGWAGQEALITNYDSTDTLVQNCILLDSGVADDATQNIYGAIWDENNADTDKDAEFHGNIVLNIKDGFAAHFDRAAGTRVFENNVFWDVPGGYVTYPGSFTHTANVTASNLTIGNINGTYRTYWADANGVGFGDNETSGGTFSLKNSIVYDVNNYGIVDNVTSDYNCFHSNGADFYDGATDGSHDLCAANSNPTNPTTSGLLYLPRIESGSTLKTTGESGGQIGAQIIYKHGTDGTLWGETGYNTLTNEALWPFPNEDRIKTDFVSYNGDGPSGARGFCTGTSMDGSAQTLTKYIWEYLGNQIPNDIYASGSDTTADTTSPVVSLLSPSAGSTLNNTQAVTISAIDNIGVVRVQLKVDGINYGSALASAPYTQNWDTTSYSDGAHVLSAMAIDAAGNTKESDIISVEVSNASEPITGTIYYVGPDGSDSNNGTQSAPFHSIQEAAETATAGDTVLVNNGDYAGFMVQNSGTAQAPITFRANGKSVRIVSSNPYTSDSINVESWTGTPADYVVIDGFEVTSSSRYGIRVIGGRGVVVQNCNVHNASISGIFTGYSPEIRILNNTTNDNGEHGIYVSNSVVPDDNPIVRGNTVYNNGQNGIQLNGDIDEGGDGLITGALIENNIVHNNYQKGFSLISVSNSTIRNNVIYNNATSGGAAGGIHIVQEIYTTVYSNNNVVANNTIVEPRIAAIRINSGNENNILFNNICVSDNPIVLEGSGNNVDPVTNLQTAFAENIFVAAENGNYQLTATSPSIDIGVASFAGHNAPAKDCDNNIRPQGNQYDLGAYEYLQGAMPIDSPSGLMVISAN